VASRRAAQDAVPAAAPQVASPAAVPTVPPLPAPMVAVVEKPTVPAPVPTSVPPPAPAKARPLEKPAALPRPTPEPAGEPDSREHPLAAARERLGVARISGHRLAKEDFLFVLAESGRALGKHPLNPEAKYLELYARGGLAYVAGDDAVARRVLVEAFTSRDRGPKRIAHPIENLLRQPDGSIGEPNAWELALAYGDARGEAMGLLENELSAHPRSPRALKARAYLRRMQGLNAR
ncbi:MAG TPA: hypothetical protein VF554_07785, partial [Thermoanaerobaculia bacterium]